MKTNLLSWGANILNALVFIVLLINTKAECIAQNAVISSVIMIAISFVVQIISDISEEIEII